MQQLTVGSSSLAYLPRTMTAVDSVDSAAML